MLSIFSDIGASWLYSVFIRSAYTLGYIFNSVFAGALYMISLKHLLATVMPGVSHDLPGAYNHWEYREDSRIGLITLYEYVLLVRMYQCCTTHLTDKNREKAPTIWSSGCSGLSSRKLVI